MACSSARLLSAGRSPSLAVLLTPTPSLSSAAATPLAAIEAAGVEEHIDHISTAEALTGVP